MNGDEEIEYTEFIAGCIDLHSHQLDSMLWAAFTKFDKDGNGVLSVGEISALLSEDGDLCPDKTQVKRMVKEMGAEGNNITFDAFKLHSLINGLNIV